MNIGDLGQDLEHCLKLRRQLREFRGVWAGVRRPGRGRPVHPPHWEIQLSVVTEHELWNHMWAQVSAPHFLPAHA